MTSGQLQMSAICLRKGVAVARQGRTPPISKPPVAPAVWKIVQKPARGSSNPVSSPLKASGITEDHCSCQKCHGSGLQVCQHCHGKGLTSSSENTSDLRRATLHVQEMFTGIHAGGWTANNRCRRCHGSGQVSCLPCNGTGAIVNCEMPE